ncbi:MAG: dihydrofolate reductase [Stutzerimonas stutzeri]|nr:MAG: dihydrofolate reductase [Stutzerimonas stutzeri]
MKIMLIAAMAENGVIGARGALPWHLPEDLKRFRQATWGKPIIMGRVTWASIGRPLPGRETIVMSKSIKELPGCFVVPTMDEAFAKGRELAATMGATETAVVGGEQIYRLAMPMADRILLTVVGGSLSGDAYFPEMPGGLFRLASSEAALCDGRELKFLEFKRAK